MIISYICSVPTDENPKDENEEPIRLLTNN